MGDLSGVFGAEPSEIEAIEGQYALFHDVLGKHSEIKVTLGDECIYKLTDDADFIDKAYEYGLVPCGVNPLDYLMEVEEMECDE
jgi:hypothetical protein